MASVMIRELHDTTSDAVHAVTEAAQNIDVAPMAVAARDSIDRIVKIAEEHAPSQAEIVDAARAAASFGTALGAGATVRAARHVRARPLVAVLIVGGVFGTWLVLRRRSQRTENKRAIRIAPADAAVA